MLSIEELIKVEPKLAEITDEGQEEIRRLLYDLATLALECYVEDKSKQKKAKEEQIAKEQI